MRHFDEKFANDIEHCPHCGSENISLKSGNFYVGCNDCKKEWGDLYRQLQTRALITPYRDRQVDFSKPVRVHRNLHKKTYTIKQHGLVVGHSDMLTMVKCRFLVSEKGQAKVRRTKQKNVHAFIEGLITLKGCMGTSADSNDKLPVKITYNPYEDEGFMAKSLVNRPLVVTHAMGLLINHHGVTAAYTTTKEVSNGRSARRSS